MTVRGLRRRELLLATGASGLAGGAGLALGVWYGRRKERWAKRVPPRPEPLSPSVYLALDEHGTLRVWLTKVEMGQGVMTALPMILADAMDADWARLSVVMAPANVRYGNMLTAVSSSVRELYEELSRAGAVARWMLMTAAAQRWDVAVEACTTDPHFVVHPDGRRLPYGSLAVAAGELDVPSDAPRRPGPPRLIGANPGRLDVPDKVHARTRFASDHRLPGMRFATTLHCPFPQGRLQSRDELSWADHPGLVAVEELDGAVATVGIHTWAALKAARALKPQWEGPRGGGDAQVDAKLRQSVDAEGAVALTRGDVQATIATADSQVEAEYVLPYLTHLNLEPPSALADVGPDRCEVWVGTQNPLNVRGRVAERLGRPEADVVVHATKLGGGFGRRTAYDEVLEAVELSTRIGAPVQVLWSREEDVRQDYLRPCSLHRMRAGLSSGGDLQAWQHAIASPPLLADAQPFDPLAVDGAASLPYDVPHVEVSWHRAEELDRRLGFWRSVGHSSNALAVECFVDEVAEAAGRDPVDYRLSLLKDSRHRRVIERAAEQAGWPSSDRRGWGIAAHACFDSHSAFVVQVDPSEAIRVTRVVAVVDCGIAIHPDNVVAQIEGGIAYALSAVLYGGISLSEGRIAQSNFHDQKVLRFSEMPAVEVVVLDSTEAPGGVGELGVPALGPAVLNAMASATGTRVRRLPIAIS